MMVGIRNELLTYDQIIQASGGRPARENMLEGGISSVHIDSRECLPGGLFVPLNGDTTDGHLFIEEAVKRGSSVVLVKSDFWYGTKGYLESLLSEYKTSFILVDDTLKAFQLLASAYLDGKSSLVTVGISGSAGKTTTKELIGHVLSGASSTAVSYGNLNSDIGVCIAAFSVTEENHFGVFEMGMNRIGEIEEITSIVRPEVAVLTNIGSAHIGLLGSRENIALEKKKIFSRFTGTQTGFIPETEPFFDPLKEGVRGTIKSYGPATLADFTYLRNMGIRGHLIKWRGEEIHLKLPGKYNILNACAAIEVGMYFSLSDSQISEGLSKGMPLFGRGEIKEKGDHTLICDYYNANPESVFNALDFIDSIEGYAGKVVVLGDMRELGGYSGKVHEDVGLRTAECSAEFVLFFGPEMKKAYDRMVSFRSEGVFWTEDTEVLKNMLKKALRSNDLVLLKGSRWAALERVEDAIN